MGDFEPEEMETMEKILPRLDKSKPNSCKFTLESSIYDDGIAVFRDTSEAKGSPLAEELFAIDGTVGVKISGSEVVVTRDKGENWRPHVIHIVDSIRRFRATGKRAVGEGFEPIRIPDASKIRERVQHIFNTQINPAVASHGGVIELLDVRGTDIYLRMGGGCQGCGMANVTLKQGIEATLREELPYVGSILDVTDHAGGNNPYYAPSKK